MGTSLEVLDYVARLPIGAHAAFFYENEETAAQLFNAYVRGGIHRRERVYFVSTSSEDQQRFLDLAADGFDLQLVEQPNYVSLMDFCFENGSLNLRKASDQVRTLATNVDGSLVKGSRVIVLADQYLKKASPDELRQFERGWGWSFPYPISVICSYDTRKLADPNWGDLILELCKAHGHLIFKGIAAPKTDPLASPPLSGATAEIQP